MDKSWQNSVVLIVSTDLSEQSFGTGFVIHKDTQATYFLTCTHVVREVGGPEKIQINDVEARVVASSPEEGADLAVVSIERPLDVLPLPLSVASEEGNSFKTAGFQLSGKQTVIRELQGILGKQVGVQMRGRANRIKAWDLEITDKNPLQSGYSGSPVVDTHGHVIGVVNTQRGQGKAGVAIFIEALEKLWPEMPPGLFVQSTVNTHKVSAHAISPTRGPVFLFNMPHLPDIGEFYGRVREREELISNTRNGSSTSLVGPRRIGKTWLIDYLKLIGPAELGVNFQFATLDGTQPKNKSVSEFTAKALNAFGVPLPSNLARLDLDALERLVKDLNVRDIRPVLCIDEFEGFFNREAFDCDFFGGLRYISQHGLVMIIASKHPLIDLIGERCMMTSGLFNVFEQHTLKPFNKSEAEEFARAKSEQAGFTLDERAALLTYGQDGQYAWPPLRLQLAGKMLLADKHLAGAGRSGYYQPDSQAYWREFEQRLEEMYRGVVR